MRSVFEVEIDGMRARATVETTDTLTHSRLSMSPEAWPTMEGQIHAAIAGALRRCSGECRENGGDDAHQHRGTL